MLSTKLLTDPPAALGINLWSDHKTTYQGKSSQPP